MAKNETATKGGGRFFGRFRRGGKKNKDNNKKRRNEERAESPTTPHHLDDDATPSATVTPNSQQPSPVSSPERTVGDSVGMSPMDMMDHDEKKVEDHNPAQQQHRTPSFMDSLRNTAKAHSPRRPPHKSRFAKREKVPIEKPPPAAEAAFGGPPRYDWIDIETAAAIKVQAAYRRNKAMTDLEKRGMTTSAIRNRSRRRRAARHSNTEVAGSEDIPSLFRCCGVGLAFGDASEEDYEKAREQQKEQYEQRKKQNELREEQIREQFRKKHWTKKKQAPADEEAYEVVEEDECELEQ